MKLQIVSQIPKEEAKSTEFQYILPNQLDSVENGVYTYIELSNILDYIPNRLNYLQVCIQKLRPKGIISLFGLDILEMSKQILSGRITIEEITKVLYEGKQSIDNIQRLLLLLTNNLNMAIIDKRISGCVYFIKAARQ